MPATTVRHALTHRLLPALLPVLLAGLLGACGGGTAQGPGDVIAAPAPDTKQVVGLWTPAGGAAKPSFEFFASATEAPFQRGLRTGRLWQDGRVSSLFTWELLADGTITLNLVSPSCATRPLASCPAAGSARIAASGRRTQDSSWSIDFDQDGDGKPDARSADRYHREEIDLSRLKDGEFFLTHLDNPVFDAPLRASVKGSALALGLDDLGPAPAPTASGFAARQDTLSFAAGLDAAVTSTQDFYVVGSGYRALQVKHWFEQVALTQAAGGAYALSYEVHHRVQLPEGVTRAQVQADAGSLRIGLDEYEAVTATTRIVKLFERFIAAPAIAPGDKFHLSLELNFSKAGEANELLFTSSTAGVVTSRLATRPDAVSEQRAFTWRRRADDALVLSFAGYGDVVLRFIQPIGGGYQVLYERPDTGFGPSWRVRDMLRDAAPVVSAADLAGRYIFTSTAALPSGSREYSVTFHRDGRISGTVGGYWFQDANGDLVGYECTSVTGQDIRDYATCAAALDDTSGVRFAHVRRLRFVHRDGNQLQARYNASVYGTRTFLVYPPSGDPVQASKFFTAVGAPVQSTALTYRFVRVGDE